VKARDIPVLTALVLALICYILWQNEKEQRKKQEEINHLLRKEVERIKQAYLDLLISFVAEGASAKPDTIRELEALKGEIDELDKGTHLEIDSVIRHVTEGEHSKALRDLAKIVENRLKEQIHKDQSFGKKNPTLANMLSHALSSKWIDEQEYHNGIGLKDIRNEESHELAVTVTPLDACINVLAGIKLIYVLAKRV
jgi:hypothetical protein